MKKAIRVFDIFAALCLAVIYSLVIYGTIMLPDKITLYGSSDEVIDEIYTVTSHADKSVDLQNANSVGSKKADLKLFGVIPVKNEVVTSRKTQTVLVSGEPFGIKLYTDGVIVVGVKDVNVGGKIVNPSKEAGIEVGDVIIMINSVRMYSSNDVEKILNDNNGKDYSITVKRDGRLRTFTVTPIYVPEENCFKAGMWVRDSTAGIGTITFYNSATNSVATLGHPITDVDTGKIMPILNGEAVEIKVTSVIKSCNNETGSLCCDFSSRTIGVLTENTMKGVYGKYNEKTDLSSCIEYPVAAAHEIKKGFAQIICTVEGEEPKVYSIQIDKIFFNDEEKNMVIRITDKNLISKTGGIVQGMSGTPIIQNGKLIGAITHVIVNNPQKGYAIFAQTMLEETE